MRNSRFSATAGADGASVRRIRHAPPPGGQGIATEDPGPFSPVDRRAFAVGASTLAVTAGVLAVANPGGFKPGGLDSLAHALVVVVPVAVGIYALYRGAAARFAFLLIAAGLFWAPTLLTLSDNNVQYSIGRVWAWLLEPTLFFLVLAFPAGRLAGRIDRWVVGVSVAIVGLLFLPSVLFVHDFPAPSPFNPCTSGCPDNAFMVTGSRPAFVESFLYPFRELLTGLVYITVAGLVLNRLTRATRIQRWSLAPLLVVAFIRMGAAVGFLIARNANPESRATQVLGTIGLLTIPAIALALVVGIVHWRIQATRALKRLAGEMGEGLTAGRARDLLARAIGDPTLEIAYWSEDPGGWVDSEGEPVELPRETPERAVSEIWAGGRLVAALVTDVTIISEPAIAEVARGFTLMALENRRLDAELGSSLRELRESRARVIAAADRERVRIERDLHDGAQQRLVALRVGIQLAHEALDDGDTERAGTMMKRLGNDMDAAVDEVRRLARGMSPPLLADHGLGEALRAAARRSTLSVVVHTRGLGRYPQEIESAVYFCCLEALQNAEKHARAESAQVRVFEDDELRFEVADDGIGIDLDSASDGRGLVNMRDRIASVRGRIIFEPMPDGGTRVVGSVPVGVARLSPEVELLLQRATDVFQDCFAIYNVVRDVGGYAVDFVIEHVNDAACREAGLPREAQLGRTLTQLGPLYLGDELRPWLVDCLRAEEPSSTEKVTYGPVAAGVPSIVRAYDVQAAPLGGGRLAVIWRDITERKRADQQLQRQATILRRASEGVCMVRAADGVIVYTNVRFAEVLGYTVDELDGTSLIELGWDWDDAGDEQEARMALAHVEALGDVRYEVRVRSKDGTPIWCEGQLATFTHPEFGRVWVIVQQEMAGGVVHEHDPALPSA